MSTDHDIEALLATMRRQGQAEKDEILAEAQAEAQQVYARAESEIHALTAESLRQSEIQIGCESDRILGRAQMENRSEVFATKNRLLRRAFEQARQEICVLPNAGQYKSLLEILIEQAITSVGQDGCITVAEQDLDLCEAIIAEKKFACTVGTLTGRPGAVIATSKDGRRRVNNSLETRLARVEQLMKQDIAQMLFASQAVRDDVE